MNLDVAMVSCPSDSYYGVQEVGSGVRVHRSNVENADHFVVGRLQCIWIDVLVLPDVAEKPLRNIERASAHSMMRNAGTAPRPRTCDCGNYEKN